MANRKFLKAFVRFDANGRVVPGSLILRKKEPATGNWMEVQAYECCDPFLTTTTTAIIVSDVRLKQNIFPTGNRIGGLREYVWEWNSLAKDLQLDHYPTRGVLAQEALCMYPEHVFLSKEDGYFRVDYNAIANL